MITTKMPEHFLMVSQGMIYSILFLSLVIFALLRYISRNPDSVRADLALVLIFGLDAAVLLLLGYHDYGRFL